MVCYPCGVFSTAKSVEDAIDELKSEGINDIEVHYLRGDRPLTKRVIRLLDEFMDIDCDYGDSSGEGGSPYQGSYEIVTGNLVELAKKGEFDVITHGCNCFSKMWGGLALEMAQSFECDSFPMEGLQHKGKRKKLGTIDYEFFVNDNDERELVVVNSYTQFLPGPHGDLEAIKSCLKRINEEFCGLKIGINQIGTGIAGLSWSDVEPIIKRELKNCDVVVVVYEKKS